MLGRPAVRLPWELSTKSEKGGGPPTPQKKVGKGSDGPSAANVTCFICGKVGHFAKNCSQKTSDADVSAAMKAAAKEARVEKKRKAEEEGEGDSAARPKGGGGFHRGRKEARR